MSEIRVYPIANMENNLDNSFKGRNYDHASNDKKLPKKLNFLEILLEAQNRSNYI